MKKLGEKINQLPPDYQREVEGFVEFLLAKKRQAKPQPPTFEWAGALKDLRNEYDSVSLQHEIGNLRFSER